MKQRCTWAGNDPLMVAYHDHEWGVPLHDDKKLFEFLCLEGAQAGLSWSTVLKKREAYCLAFDRFEPNLVAGYDETRIQALLQNQGIIRNNLKVRAFITNAIRFLAIQSDFGRFDNYLWQFVNQAFSSILPEQYETVNREQDLGIPGLRQAKLSYQPELIYPANFLSFQ